MQNVTSDNTKSDNGSKITDFFTGSVNVPLTSRTGNYQRDFMGLYHLDGISR